jgi:ABC-type dipeptide/oligopeptide/nickel transport system ATPase component
MIFQNQLANLHPKLTVGEMLDESLRLHRPELDKAARQAQIEALLGEVGLVDKLNVRPARLSGGERRRVGLARILATRPKLVIADEPTSGLDAAIKLQMISLLKDLKSPETTYLIISHDLGLVRRIATRIIVLLKGRIVEDFPASRLDEGFEHHPYTQRLMHAADLFDANGDRRGHKAPSVVEEGFLDGRTDAIFNAEGCVYACDCQRGSDLNLIHMCAKERPPLVDVALGHRLACFAAAKEGMSTPDNAPSTDETLKEKV